MFAIVTQDENVAIKTLSKTGYTLCLNVPGQRRTWKTQDGALKALDNLRKLNPSGASILKILSVAL